MSLYQSAVRRPVTTALIFVAIVIIGLFSLTKLSTDLYPKIDMNSIMVITTYNGASAEDIENTVSRPVENVLNTVSNVKHIKSNSMDNFSTVSLEFESGSNMDVATNDVRDKLDRITSALPKEASKPLIFKFSMDDIPIMVISAQAVESAKGLDKIIDDNLTNRIARLDGVGSVQVVGAPIREINIYCNPEKLEAYHLTVEQISQAVQMSNRNIPIGSIDIGSKTASFRLQGEFENVKDVEDIVVGGFQGRNVYLRDVAEVHDGDKERMQESYNNGTPGGYIIIRKQSGANSVAICNSINKILPEIQASMPSDVKLIKVMDTSEYITNTINSLLKTILIIFVVVILVVLFFLGRWRATFIIVLTIPISLIAAFIYLMESGNTLNVISLSALSIAIGMVVDDAIVVLENITTHIERGSFPKQAAIYATNEVALSVIASTLTMLAVFLPLTMVTGFTGVMFRQLGWVVSIVMIISTISALTLTPMLSSQMLRRTVRNSRVYDKIFDPIKHLLDKLDKAYAKALAWCVYHRKTVIVGATLIFLGSLMLMPFVKTEFLPDNDQGYITGTIELPQGYSKDKALDFANMFSEEMRAKYPEDLTSFSFTVGQADDDNIFAAFQGSGSNIISINVLMPPFDQRTMTTTQLTQTLREELSQYPVVESYNIKAGEGFGGSPYAVQLEIYGHSFDKTNKVAEQFVEKIKSKPACSEVNLSRKPSSPEYNVVFDDEKLAMYGLTKTTAATSLRNAITGITSSYFREDGKEYTIKVRYAQQYRESLESIENILITTPRGATIRLRDLGEIRMRETPPTIERKDRERYMSIGMTTASGYAMSDLVTQCREVMKEIELPEGASWKLAGQFETQQESFGDLFALMILIILLVFIVMAAEFESLVDPFVIMFSVPFAFSGVILGLVITGTPMGVMALIGAIMLIGIVVKNGIVLIDYTILCRERGNGILASVVMAGKSRLRPVLMTTATTVLGMLPLAFGRGEGAELWRSMGMTVAFGLTVSTMITLVIVPTVYAIFAGNGIKRKRKKFHKKRVQELAQ